MTGTALITGAANRIGRAIAVRMAQDGCAVAVHYRQSPQDADETVRLISENGGTAAPIQADFENEGELAGLVDKAATALGQKLNILINNASLFEKDDVRTANATVWARHMQVNLRAPFVLSQNFAAAATSQDSRLPANIINIIDQRVLRLTSDFLSYTISKSALWTLTQTLALAMAPDIRVNGIAPGPVLASKHQDAESFLKEVQNVPLGRGPDPTEIAATVAFILASPSMTGQLITLDGGQHLGWQTPDKLVAGEGTQDD